MTNTFMQNVLNSLVNINESENNNIDQYAYTTVATI